MLFVQKEIHHLYVQDVNNRVLRLFDFVSGGKR